MRAPKSFLAIVLLFFSLIFGYHEYRRTNGAADKTVPRRPRNVYIITASGLRPDHLSSYLYQHGQTTAIDYLAYDGIRFLNAFSTSSDSLPAHLSLLTGLYPFSKELKQTLDALDGSGVFPRALPSLPEWFAKKGYKTAAFLSDPELRSPALFQNLFQEVAWGDQKLFSWEPAYTPSQVSLLARDWALRNSGDTQFLLVNFSEPTLPFKPPKPYSQQYANHPYDGEIAGLDESVGLLIHTLKEAGLFQNSIVIFAGPYGESLDQETRTGSLNPSIIRIPLLIAAPGLLPAHEEYGHEASLIDVFPTVLTLLDQRSGNVFDGIPLFKKGTSEEIVREFIFAESRIPLRFGLSPDFFITNGKSYYESSQQIGDTRLRDMLEGKIGKLPSLQNAASANVSPGPMLEQTLLLARTKETAKALNQLASLQSKFPSSVYLMTLKAELLTANKDYQRAADQYRQVYQVSHNSQVLNSLSQLQLLAGNNREVLELQNFYRKTASCISYLDRSTMGIAAYHTGDYALAQHELNSALEQNPRLADAYLYRGLVFEKQNRLLQAEADLKKAVDLNPDDLSAARELGRFLESQKRAADAIPYFRTLLERNSRDYEAMLELARLQEESGNDQAARKLCEQVLLYAEDPVLRSRAREIIAR